MRRLILLILISTMLWIPSQAQQQGQGLIRIGVVNNLDTDLTSFNPLLCDDATCDAVLDLLFPTLLAVEPETGWFTEATSNNNAMAVDWTFSEDNQVITFQLREDALWSDGTAITAYDYFYNFLAIESNLNTGFFFSREITRDSIEGVVPLSDYELAVILEEPACDLLTESDLQFIPAHVFDDNFVDTARDFFDADGDIQQLWSDWEASFEYDFNFMLEHPFNDAPMVTGDYFQFVDWDNRQHIRLQRGNIALEFVPVSSESQEIDRFLQGNLSLIHDIPAERIADFEANPGVQVHENPAQLWNYIVFNLADPDEPASAFDEDGNPLEQGEHPILSDITIRQAISLGINVDNLIDIALHGQGARVPAYFTPGSWAFDDSLSPLAYNPDEAERLLEESGWVRVGNNNIRECVDCGTVRDGTRLSLSLGHLSSRHYPVAAIVIAQQLRRIGIEINSYATDYSDVFRQRFDLFLGIWGEDTPTAGLIHEMLIPEEDVISSGFNLGSYYNPELTEIVNQARTVSACDLDERRALYTRAEAIIQQDLPYIPLYHEMWTTVLRSDIQNVQIYPAEPFSQIDDWVVFDVP